MNIEMVEQSDSPLPMFIVYAQNEQERIILKLVCNANEFFKDQFEFKMHGPTYHDGRCICFNFGMVKK